jgi:hypothetical protein
MCGAIGDSGGFCDKTNDALIDQTLTSGNLSYMYTWQNYLAPSTTVAVFRRVTALPLSVMRCPAGVLHSVTSFRPLLATLSRR